MSREILTGNHLRSDFRKPLELRRIEAEILPSANDPMPNGADAAATVTQGLTKVRATVYGFKEPERRGVFGGGSMSTAASAALLSASEPMGVSGFLGSGAPAQSRGGASGKLSDDGLVKVDVSSEPWSEASAIVGVDGAIRRASREKSDQDISSAVKKILDPLVMKHLFARSSLNIHIQVVEADGGVLAAAVNSAMLALTAAGVPLFHRVTALTAGSFAGIRSPQDAQVLDGAASKTGSTVLLDLIAFEENALPHATVAAYSNGQLAWVSMDSRLGIDRFNEMVQWALRATEVAQAAFDAAIQNWAQRVLDPLLRQSDAGRFPSLLARREPMQVD